MRRTRSALLHARALLLAGLVAVAPSTLLALPVTAGAGHGSAGPASVDARGPQTTDRTVRLHGSAAETRAGNRPARHIVASELPKATGKEHTYIPKRLGTATFGRGSGSGSTKSPTSFPTTPLAPTQVTPSTTNPATEAVGGAGTAEGLLEPPDAALAAGPDHVVQATNEGIRITNRALATSTAPVTLASFFGIDADPNYDAVTFDPHVIYDSVHGRWLATEASFDCVADAPSGIAIGTGYIDIAISDTADPTLGWSILSVPYPDTVPDFPGLGTSTDKIVVSANVFDLKSTPGVGLGCDIDEVAGLTGTELDAVTWAQMLGSGDVDIAFLTSYIAPIDFTNDFFTFRPAVQTPAQSTSPQLSNVVGVGVRLSTSGVVWFKVSGSPSAGTTAVSIANVTGADPFDDAVPVPQQPGGTIADAVDGRPTDAVWQNNRLVFVSTTSCDPAGGGVEDRDCVRITELDMSTATPTVAQDMLIGETGRDLYMGGAGFSQNSDLHVVWTGSSSTAADYPSTWTAYQLATQAHNTLTGKQKIGVGSATYTGTRWGDYVSVAQDPQVPDAVWQADEHSVGDWATHVSQLRTFAGSSYTAITPLRVMSSRDGIGLTKAKFVANTPRTFQVTNGGTIPSNAIAVTGNVTVTGQTGAGFVSVTPTPTATPPSSTINFPVGDVRANNFTLPLGPGGKLSAVYRAATGKTTDILVDISGYFVVGSAGDTWIPLATPTRVLNTRDGTGLSGVFLAGTPRTLPLAGTNGIPATATAITGNLTVADQTKAGYLSVTPDPPVGTPGSSTMNFPVGDLRANGLTADLNGAGELSITYSAPTGATTNVLLDVTGYYIGDGSGALFYPLSPGRLMDTRLVTIGATKIPTPLSQLSGVFNANTARTLPTTGHWGIPAGATAITGNLTVVGQTAAGYVAATPVATNSPQSSTLNFPLGDTRANGVTVPLSGTSQAFVYKAGTGKKTDLLLDVTGYFK